MNLVFISNIEFSKPAIADHDYSHIATIASSIDSICALFKQIKKDGNIVFIIDVHCTIKRSENMQDQGGIIIYRHLLKQFEKCQDKLKVVFYSPLSAKYLSALKPENYVLTLLPFVECDYEEGSFKKKLDKIISDNTFPKFNNASENLLSGWSLNDENKVEVKKKEIVFVDDQAEEWRKTFEKVFKLGKGGVTVPEIFPYNKKNNGGKVFSLDKLDESFTEKIRASDLVISDFYLEENHESNNWMDAEELSKISGFQLFQEIKGKKNKNGIHKGVPVVMHTSSNKVQYYKFFDANGVDNWLVKDIRPNVTKEEKKENYKIFKTTIEEFTIKTTAELYSILKIFWGSILKIEENTSSNWWYNNSLESKYTSLTYQKGKSSFTTSITSANIETRKEVLFVLKDSWIALRSLLNKEEYFVENIGSNDKNFTASSICNNLGKLIEFFGLVSELDFNYTFKFLCCIRNAASHYADYRQFEKKDTLIYMALWLTLLDTTKENYTEYFAKKGGLNENIIQQNIEEKGVSAPFQYGLLYAYIQYYNCDYSKVFPEIKKEIGKRIQSLYDKADKAIILNEVLTNNGSTIPGGGLKKNLKKAVCVEEMRQDVKNIKLLTPDNNKPVDKYLITSA